MSMSAWSRLLTRGLRPKSCSFCGQDVAHLEAALIPKRGLPKFEADLGRPARTASCLTDLLGRPVWVACFACAAHAHEVSQLPDWVRRMPRGPVDTEPRDTSVPCRQCSTLLPNQGGKKITVPSYGCFCDEECMHAYERENAIVFERDSDPKLYPIIAYAPGSRPPEAR